MVVLLFSEERIRMLFPALRLMSLACMVLPLTIMSSLAMTAAVLPAVTVLPFVSSVMVSAWSFHPVLPRLILIPTAYIYPSSLLSALTLNFSYAFRSSEVKSDTDEITCISSLLYFAKDLSISCFSSNGCDGFLYTFILNGFA